MEIEEFVGSIKPFSKIYIFSSLICGIILTLKVVSPYYFVLMVPQNLYNPFKYISSIVFFPKINMSSIMDLLFFYFTANQLETSYLPHRYGEFILLILYAIVGNYLIVIPFSWNNFVILRKALSLTLTYLFCRKYPNSSITVFFVIKLKAMYFIWFQMIMAILEDRVIYAVSALIVGHSYYFLKEVLPVVKRVSLLNTPAFMNKFASWFLHIMNERNEPQRGQVQQPQPNRFANVRPNDNFRNQGGN